MTIADYLSALRHSNFSGEIRTDFSTRLALSTDNSIYQRIPEAVLFPKTHQDIVEIFKLAGKPEFKKIRFSPRAGGTGTDGQSLTSDILIDCSKYLREILEINLEAGYARVQAGVVLDQLNNILKPHGVFFAPQVSPSNRACIGGMFNTDGCGLGSAKYGRTSEHVLGVTAVLINGEVLNTQARTLPLSNHQNLSPTELNLSEKILTWLSEHQNLIQEKALKMPRFLTGYNLLHPLQNNQLDLTRLLSGSEGTLAMITELTVKLTPLPKHKALLVIKYLDFDRALRHGASLLIHQPEATETIDDKIINLARKDEVFLKVKPMFEYDGPDETTQAINLIEFTHEHPQALLDKIQEIKTLLAQDTQINGIFITQDPKEISAWWELRKKSVGLLANLPGKRQPVPFVEDTAVDPSVLPEFIRDFRAVLDQDNLVYGMFGHIDTGCIHVRPALDMTDPDDAKKVKIISDKIQKLVKHYGGLLWAEHGAGFRSHYIPEYFGPELTQLMVKIKTLFDPENQLNPGKIISSDPSIPIVRPGEELRATRESQVPSDVRHQFEKAFKCNGNAICMNVMPDIAICPSYKITRDRVHSPKGRAVLMREYLRQESLGEIDLSFAEEVKKSMDGCLGCKSCVSGCPVNVDVPSFKSEFYARYYRSKLRSLRDILTANFERLTQIKAWFVNIGGRCLSRADTQVRPYRKNQKIRFATRITGLVDLPKISKNLSLLKQIPKANSKNISQAQKPILLMGDVLTRFHHPELLLDAAKLIKKLGYTPLLLPFIQNGKSFHALGYLKKFEYLAKKNQQFLKKYFDQNIPILGIEPALTLAFRDEYKNILEKNNNKIGFSVQLISEWLEKLDLSGLKGGHAGPPLRMPSKSYAFISHCSEKSLVPYSAKHWQKIFTQMGLDLILLEAGCCGMAGVYGHQIEHQENSKNLYELSWETHVKNYGENLLATGHSCRSQIKRLGGGNIKHPLSVLTSYWLND